MEKYSLFKTTKECNVLFYSNRKISEEYSTNTEFITDHRLV